MKNKIEEIVDDFLQDSLCNIDYEHEYIQEQRALMIDKLEDLFNEDKGERGGFIEGGTIG